MTIASAAVLPGGGFIVVVGVDDDDRGGVADAVVCARYLESSSFRAEPAAESPF
jgi:hypothetical protein